MESKRKSVIVLEGRGVFDSDLFDEMMSGKGFFTIKAEKQKAIDFIASQLARCRLSFIASLGCELHDRIIADIVSEAARRGFRNGNGNYAIGGLVG